MDSTPPSLQQRLGELRGKLAALAAETVQIEDEVFEQNPPSSMLPVRLLKPSRNANISRTSYKSSIKVSRLPNSHSLSHRGSTWICAEYRPHRARQNGLFLISSIGLWWRMIILFEA